MGYVFDRKFPELVPERHGADAALIGRIFLDAETTWFVTRLLRKMVYEANRERSAV